MSAWSCLDGCGFKVEDEPSGSVVFLGDCSLHLWEDSFPVRFLVGESKASNACCISFLRDFRYEDVGLEGWRAGPSYSCLRTRVSLWKVRDCNVCFNHVLMHTGCVSTDTPLRCRDLKYLDTCAWNMSHSLHLIIFQMIVCRSASAHIHVQ